MENWLNNSISLTISIVQCLNSIVHIHTSELDCIVVAGILNAFDFPYIQVDYEGQLKSESFPGKADFYIVEEDFITNFSLLTKTLGDVTSYNWNPRGKFLFVGTNFTHDFLRLISSYYIINAVFLNTKTQELSTYIPFRSGILNVIDTNFEKIGQCGSITLERLYIPQLPLTWINSSISIIYRPYNPYAICHDCREKGIEFDVINIIFKHLNISATYSIKRRNFSLANVFLKYHMLLGSYAAVDAESGHLADFSTSFVDDEALWVVPAPLALARWKYFLKIFGTSTLTIFGIVVIIMTAIWISGELLFYHKISMDMSLMVPRFVYHIFLGQAFTYRTNTVSSKILVLLIIYVSYMMNLLFYTRLTYLLNGHNVEDTINSFAEIVDNQLVIGCPRDMKRHFNSSASLAEYLETHYEDCDVGNTCLRRAAFSRDMAVCKASRRIRYEVSFTDNETGDWLLAEVRPALYDRHTSAFFNGVTQF
ncbi:hypothetical protein WA026_002748 [Henosepilachna vigintioctopunctata]|uniref:Ionotropic receptor n=1 Tax=Henosepilachna vigintioctopunctata TaxID=420089 RepID=A0AAW1U1K7_9CUCU